MTTGRIKRCRRGWDFPTWVNLSIQKGLTFYQTRSNAIILQGTLPAYCIPKVVRLKTGQVFVRNHTCLLGHHQRSHLRHDHDWTRGNDELGSTIEQQPVGKLVRQSSWRSSTCNVLPTNPTNPQNQSVIDQGNLRTCKMCLLLKVKRSRSHKIDEKGLHEELGSSDRSGKPDKLFEDISVMHAHDGTGEPVKSSASTHTVKEQFVPEENRDIASFNTDNEFNRAINEENIDFNIPGLPHSAVKRSHGVNVQNLIQKIENHPHRRALQSDLQQHRQFNPFSKESRKVIKAAGNTELCELLDVEPKAQCKVCLSYWGVGIVYSTCGHFLRDETKENKRYPQVHC